MTPVEQITSLYIGYFGRAPDPVGLNYWVGRLADGFSLAEIAESFSVQAESQAKYPYLANPNIASPQAFITQVYLNLFNRVPDAEGLAYWTAQLESGTDIGDFILDVISGAVTNPDRAIIENKVEVGVDFALEAANQPGFVYNDDAAAAAVEVINGVDATQASVDAAKAETDAFISGGTTGDVFTLTTALGEQVIGTAGNDTFNVIAGTGATINSFDLIDGAGGRDTLNLITDAAAGGLPTASQMRNVEIINAELAASVLSINSSALAGVTDLNLAGDLSGLANVTLGAGQSVAFGASAAGAVPVTVTVDAAETDTTITLVDAADTTDITLLGAANTTLTVEGSVAGAGTLAVTAAATTETLNLELSSDSVLTITGAALTAIDASASTGDLTIVGTATTEAILGGSGVDTLTGGAASQLINGGAGDDIITAGGVAGEVIIGGAGADDIDLGANAVVQSVVVNAGETGLTLATIDQVANFVSASDTLDFNLVAGSATNFVFDGSAGGYLDALTNANTAFAADSALRYAAISDTVNTWVFVNNDSDADADFAVELTGVTAVAFGDIVA